MCILHHTCRSEFARELTEGTSVDPTDVFIVTQDVTLLQPGSGTECVNFILRITGENSKCLYMMFLYDM